MTGPPPNFAESPEMSSSVAVDALSDVLHAIHLRGSTVARRDSSHTPVADYPEGNRTLHIVERAAGLQLHVKEPRSDVILNAGDMVLLARGQAHTLRADGPSSWVTGTFVVDDDAADPLLAVLPSAVVIRNDHGEHDWLGLSLDLLLDELGHPGPGSQVMVSRILDLLFIHALRAWAARGDAAPGWLTAAMDTTLGPIISSIHRAPGDNWSVEELARRATMSRSAFAGRFTRLVGVSPAAYVTTQRLDRAAHLLGVTSRPVREIAAEIGYASEAAFSRAFHRRYGAPPRQWRINQRS